MIRVVIRHEPLPPRQAPERNYEPEPFVLSRQSVAGTSNDSFQSTFPLQVPAILNSAIFSLKFWGLGQQSSKLGTQGLRASPSAPTHPIFKKTHWEIASSRTPESNRNLPLASFPTGNFHSPLTTFPLKTPMISNISSNFHCLHFATIPNSCSFAPPPGLRDFLPIAPYPYHYPLIPAFR
jgi:hypothetical protein